MNAANALKCLDIEEPWDAYLTLFLDHKPVEKDRFGLSLADRQQHVLRHHQTLGHAGGAPGSLISMAQNKDASSVLFLGTGCAEPSDWRGGSAIMIRLDSNRKAILLDCGEGTYGQMVRYLGPSGAAEAVRVAAPGHTPCVE